MAINEICKVGDCNKPLVARGLCSAHYNRWRRYGNALAGGACQATNGEPLEFLKRSIIEPGDACIIWPFSKFVSGHGQIKYGGINYRAHRLAWELYHGRKMASDKHAAHAPLVCHNPSCVNPLHIREATAGENSADKVIDGTANAGERHPNAKLCENDVVAIREIFNKTDGEIADAFGVSRSTINAVRCGRTWRRV